MHQRVHDPNAHIRPSSLDGRRIVDSQVGKGQDGADEVSRLLMQVVEVLRGPLQVRRQHFLHARGCEGGVGGDFVFGEGGEAFGVHPAFHDEGPEVEGDLFCIGLDFDMFKCRTVREECVVFSMGLRDRFRAHSGRGFQVFL
jgi:hypothetical protein